MRFNTVTQHLLRPMDKLVVKLSVGMVDKRTWSDGYYNILEHPSASYLTFNFNPAVILQYKSDLNVYDPSHSIRITDDVLYQFNKSLQEFYKKLLRPDLFTYFKGGGITCNPRRDDTKTISLKTGGFIELSPTVIVDNNINASLPGVLMYLNNHDNKIELSLDEFESIMYKLSKIDIASEGMQLIIAAELMELRTNNQSATKYPQQIQPSNTPKSMFDRPKTESEQIRRKPTMNIFQKAEAKPPAQDEVISIGINTVTHPTSLDNIIP